MSLPRHASCVEPTLYICPHRRRCKQLPLHSLFSTCTSLFRHARKTLLPSCRSLGPPSSGLPAPCGRSSGGRCLTSLLSIKIEPQPRFLARFDVLGAARQMSSTTGLLTIEASTDIQSDAILSSWNMVCSQSPCGGDAPVF